ncbi:DUF2987 domain-containing protein [Vibrio sp. T187]|uniref:DUF2987 domain-containing protein n=1 Tax=Vibrio TaxID=662 RepID=UPI0010C981CE|nr:MULTISPECIES: DUF2987 domain-containing protein [Vibrio]MBW3697871.1 DUF2987 domain-containing protein [Vibrio sp. T187]
MKKTTLALLTMLGFTCALPVAAQEYMFTYSKLYTQLKNNAKEGHDDVKVGVFFVNAETKQICTIEKAWMEKEEHYEEFVIPDNNELPLPVDNNLRSANPLVFVQTQAEGQCDYSLVVMTKNNLEGTVTYEQVETLLPQMQAMLEDLSGMFSSWFTPDITGVTLEFANRLNGQIELSNGKVVPIEQGKAQLTLAEIGQGGSMVLPEPTQRVLPYISPQ